MVMMHSLAFRELIWNGILYVNMDLGQRPFLTIVS